MEFLNPKKKKYNFDKFLEDETPVEPSTIYEDPEWKDLVETVKRQAEEDLEENNKPKFLRRNHKTETHAVPKDEPEKVELNIHLTLPKIKWEKVKGLKAAFLKARASALPYIKNHQYQKIAGGLAVALILVFTVANTVLSTNKSEGGANDNQSALATGQSASKPDPVIHDVPFKIFLPDKDLPKEAISYNPNKKFAKFDDQIDSIAISVTEQTLPDNFKSSPASSLESLAKQMNATDSIETTSAGTIYVQQSAQGAQTAIFIRSNILGFVRTQNEVGVSKIAMYIDSLK